MKIIITRHGETIENNEGRFMGQLHGTLNEIGMEQAKKLAERLKDEEIDIILSSDLNRAGDTAKEIAKFHQNIPLKFTKDLRERHLGELEGKRKIDLGLNPKELVAGKIETREGETQRQMFERAKEVIQRIIQDYPNKTVLIVAHNGINLALKANLLSKSFEDYLILNPFKNASVTIFKINDNLPAIIEVDNCTKHLT